MSTRGGAPSALIAPQRLDPKFAVPQRKL
jgi:hypothetical protein